MWDLQYKGVYDECKYIRDYAINHVFSSYYDEQEEKSLSVSLELIPFSEVAFNESQVREIRDLFTEKRFYSTTSHQEKLKAVLNGLMAPYLKRVPDAETVFQQLAKRGEKVHNDHIAFRSLLGIKVLEKIFLHLNYRRMGERMLFSEKKLNAFWYKHSDPEMPRVFISELRLDELDPRSVSIIKESMETAILPKDRDRVHMDDMSNSQIYDYFEESILPDLQAMSGEDIAEFLHTPLWQKPTLEDFLYLQKQSEWGSWAIYNDYYLNHFTVAVHRLKSFDSIETFNAWVETPLDQGGCGLTLNTSGGKLKVSPDGLLLQSSTVANTVEGTFRDGKRSEIPGSYSEYAYRKILPRYNPLFEVLDQKKTLSLRDVPEEFRRDGFEVANADRIYESTFRSQVERRKK